MYIYDEYDQRIQGQRVAQFRRQTERYLEGQLEEAEFLPLRLQNGLYIQRLAPMLRICVPYGLLSSQQLRQLAHITRTYDKGYCHVTTRQNIQLHWPQLEDVPEILESLLTVQMHCNQTSGNCIRNTTTDQFAGVAPDEVTDPRPYCELIRQWSTFHPEFAFLPRKFKIAVNASASDRAAIMVHDIGVELVKDAQGALGFRVFVGGGLGRTPVIASLIREFLPQEHLLSYLEAIVRIYNQFGRRDNKFKARIKILVRALTPDVFAEKVEQEWERIRDQASTLTHEEIERAHSYFTDPAYETLDAAASQAELDNLASDNRAFSHWLQRNVHPHQRPGYAAVTLSLKPTGIAPGDITDSQLEKIADLADQFSFSEVRTTHEQNIVLADVKQQDLFTLWEAARKSGFAVPNIGTLNDIICCPGGDFCSLANAKSIPIAEAIQRQFDDLDYLYDLGEIDLNISGCMNACGHHHVGHIGILGVDKKGEEFYQILLGGDSSRETALGRVVGPAFVAEEVPTVIQKIIDVYLANRAEGEPFIEAVKRLGIAAFKERIYAKAA